MTYDAFESSQEQSEPIELYRFILGPQTFEYTSAEDTITNALIDYEPIAISRSELREALDEADNAIEVTMPGNNEFAALYKEVVPGERARLVISRLQRLDTPTPQTVIVFDGFVRSVAFIENATEAKVQALPIGSATSRIIPRFTYSSACNNVLYDDGCKVDDTDPTFQLSGTISVIDGNDITVVGATADPDGFYTSGFAELVAVNDSRMILNHVGDVLTLLLPFPGTVLNDSIVIFAGCDHLLDGDCDTKFFTPEDATSNVINYGGSAFVPQKNIFRTGLD